MFDLIDFLAQLLEITFLVKLFFLVLDTIYIIFLLVVHKQIGSMTAVLSEGYEWLLKAIVFSMIGLAILLLLTALVIL